MQSEKAASRAVNYACVNLGESLSFVRPATYSNQIPNSKILKEPLAWKEETLQVALVKIRAPQNMEDWTLRGITHTLEQLSQLGLQCVVIIDCDDENNPGNESEHKDLAAQQADRVADAIDGLKGKGARRLDSVIAIDAKGQYKSEKRIRVSQRDLLLSPLRKGKVTRRSREDDGCKLGER